MTDQQSGGNLAGLGLGDRQALEPVWHIPKGEYLCAAVASQAKANKAKTGTLLEVKLEVLEGEHKGFRLTERFNLKHPSARAVEIGLDQLKLFCTALGVDNPQDSSALHGIPVIVKVALKPGQEDGQFFNEVKGYKPRSEAGPAAPDDKPSFLS